MLQFHPCTLSSPFLFSLHQTSTASPATTSSPTSLPGSSSHGTPGSCPLPGIFGFFKGWGGCLLFVKLNPSATPQHSCTRGYACWCKARGAQEQAGKGQECHKPGLPSTLQHTTPGSTKPRSRRHSSYLPYQTLARPHQLLCAPSRELKCYCSTINILDLGTTLMPLPFTFFYLKCIHWIHTYSEILFCYWTHNQPI